MSAGSSYNLNFSYNVPGLKPLRHRILSSGTKLIDGPCIYVSTTDPRFEKTALIITDNFFP